MEGEPRAKVAVTCTFASLLLGSDPESYRVYLKSSTMGMSVNLISPVVRTAVKLQRQIVPFIITAQFSLFTSTRSLNESSSSGASSTCKFQMQLKIDVGSRQLADTPIAAINKAYDMTLIVPGVGWPRV